MPAGDAAKSLEQGNLFFANGDFQQAIINYENALGGLERLNGPEAPELAECLQNLAESYQSVGRFEDSLRTNWRLVRIGEKILGRVHPDMVSMLLKIAMTNEMMGKTDDALHIVETAIETAKQCMQSNDPLAVKLIERHTHLVKAMRNHGAARSQHDDPAQYQSQYQEQNRSPINDSSNQVVIPPAARAAMGVGNLPMQDFAREMLRDMPQTMSPESRMPFSQSVKGAAASNFNLEPVSGQEALALDPNVVSRPAPRDYSSNEPRPSYGNSLAQRPMPQDLHNDDDFEEAPYTAEAIASLTNRSKVNTRSNAKGRRLSNNEQSRIRIGRLLKDFGLPLFTAGVLIFTVCFLFSPSKQTTPTPAKGATGAPKGQLSLFEVPDGKKQVRLLGTEVAYLVTSSGIAEVPYHRINNGLIDTMGALGTALIEKQIWFEDFDSYIRSEDGSVYYSVTGPERQVLDKMRSLGAFAQSYLLRTGQFPKDIPDGYNFEFSYMNPYTNSQYNIPVRMVRSREKDGSDVRESLENGLMVGNEENTSPGYISCYAVLDSDNSEAACKHFFIRGAGKDGHFFVRDHDLPFVLVPSNTLLKGYKPAEKIAATPGKGKNNLKSHSGRATKASHNNKTKNGKAGGISGAAPNHGDISAGPDGAHSEEAMSASKHDSKNASRLERARLYLIKTPLLPLPAMHYLLPIILALCTAIAYMRSQMPGFDINGQPVRNTSAAAVITTIALALITAIALIIQMYIFA